MGSAADLYAITGQPPGPASRARWHRLSYPALFLLLVYLVPMAWLLAQSVTDPAPGWQNFERLLTQPGYLWTLGRTLGLTALSTFFALLLGYPIAWAIATTPRPWLRHVLLLCIVTPYLTSILIRTFAWQVLLSRVGLVNQGLDAIGLGPLDLLFNATAVVIGLTHYLLPLMVLPLVSIMRGIDPALLRASASLGAGPASSFARVFLPASRPGIEVGVILCFVHGVGAFVTPALLGGNSGRMLGALIESAISQQADYGLAAAASVLLALAVALLVWIFRRGMGHNVTELASPALSRAAPGRRRRAGVCTRLLTSTAHWLDRHGAARLAPLAPAWALICGLLVLLPQLIAIPLSFSSTRATVFPPPGWSLQWYRNVLTPEWTGPFWTSLQIAIGVALLSAIIGGLAAVGVARGLRGRAAGAVNLLLILPLIFPTVVAAAAFFLAWLPLSLTDTRMGILIAHLCVSAPFVFVIASASLKMLDPALERAAASLGAGPWTQLRRIILPLISGGLLTGTLLAFLNSFDEAAIAIFLSGLDVKTLPRRMYESLAVESEPTVAVIAVLTTALTLALLALKAWREQGAAARARRAAASH